MKIFKLLFLLFFTSTSWAHTNNQKIFLQLMWLDQFEFAGFYMAKEKGFYDKVGLDVEFIKYSEDTNIVQSVLSKKADFGVGSSSLLIDKSNGKDIVLLGSIFQSSPLMLMGLKDSKLEHLEDIKGKNVMLTQDQKRFATLQAMLSSRNIQIEDFNVLEHSFNVDDLINKKIDLMLAYTTNEPYILKEKGYEAKIFYPKDYGFDFYENIIFTTNAYAKENPQIVAKFYAASIKGWKYAFEHIKETSQLIFKKYNAQNKSLDSLIFEALEMKKLSYTKEGNIGEMTKEKLKLIEQSYRILGLLDKDLDMNTLLYTHHLNHDITLSDEEKEYLAKKEVINMCIDPNWMPFEKNDQGKHIGVTADYFKLLQKRLPIPIKVIFTKTWSESLVLGKQRKCDIFSLVMPTPERLSYLDFTKPYLKIPLVIASDLHTTYIDSLEQVQNEKLAIVKDYAYGEILRVKYPHINFIDVENIKEGLKEVKEGRVFGFIGSLSTVGYNIQKNYIGQLKITGKFQDTWDLSIGTRNDEPLLKSIFEKSMDTINSESRQSILNKWISVNYSKSINTEVIIQIVGLVIIGLLLLILVYRQFLLKDLNKQLNEKVKEEIDKNNEQQKVLSQQAKMAAMGEMIGNIAHQWRQPLSTISIAATGMKFQKDLDMLSDEEFDQSIESIRKSTQFLSDTIDDFRNFFNSNQVISELKIQDILEKSFDLFGIKFSNKDIQLIKNIPDITIKTYENELIQVMINLLNNSKDAMVDLQEKYIFIDVTVEKENVVIKVKDNAGGIPEDIIHRVFEPYFTTKHQSQGTGIGLYMSEEIINKHMVGSIMVTNESYEYNGNRFKGAQFVIHIPVEI